MLIACKDMTKIEYIVRAIKEYLENYLGIQVVMDDVTAHREYSR